MAPSRQVAEGAASIRRRAGQMGGQRGSERPGWPGRTHRPASASEFCCGDPGSATEQANRDGQPWNYEVGHHCPTGVRSPR